MIDFNSCIPSEDAFEDKGNYQLNDIVTLIKIEKYRELLEVSGFDKCKSEYLLKGFE